MKKNKDKKAKQKPAPTHDIANTTAAGLRPGDVVVRRHRGRTEPGKSHDVEYVVTEVTHFRGAQPVGHYLDEPDTIQCTVLGADGSVQARRWQGPVSLSTYILIRRPKAPAE